MDYQGRWSSKRGKGSDWSGFYICGPLFVMLIIDEPRFMRLDLSESYPIFRPDIELSLEVVLTPLTVGSLDSLAN